MLLQGAECVVYKSKARTIGSRITSIPTQKSISHKLEEKMPVKWLFNLVMLIFMVSVIENGKMVKVVEGTFCWTPSRTFHGICIIHKNCEAACVQEGYVTGECKGLVDRHCMCGGECGGNPPPEGGDTPPPPEGGDTPPGGDFTPPHEGPGRLL